MRSVELDLPIRQKDPEITWPNLPSVLRLEYGHAYVFVASLALFLSQLDHIKGILSQEENSKASRFHFPVDRSSFIIRRGIRRVLLGRILGMDPVGIQFCHGPNGKPELELRSVDEQLYFNDSHSGSLALYGFSRDCQIGVDVEQVKPVPNLESIAASYFTGRESRELMGVLPDGREEAFISCWTRKEAVLKSTGEGIGTGLANVEVSIDLGIEKEIVKADRALRNGPDWTVHTLKPAVGFLAAIAYQHSELSLNSWNVSARIFS